jgi:hypothetical protein
MAFLFGHPMAYSTDCGSSGWGDLLYAILFVWVYVRGREDTPWNSASLLISCDPDYP